MLKTQQQVFYNAITETLLDISPHDLKDQSLEKYPGQSLHEKALVLSWISSDEPDERMQIYRNTMLNNLIYALSLTYPGVWQLLGGGCANQVAKLFLKTRQMPRTGCLDDWGSSFVEFLSTVPELESLYYLSDYARYEWLKHECESAPEASSLRMMQSEYALDTIEVILNNTQAGNIQLTQVRTYAILVKEQGITSTYWLSKDKLERFYDKC